MMWQFFWGGIYLPSQNTEKNVIWQDNALYLTFGPKAKINVFLKKNSVVGVPRGPEMKKIIIIKL